MTRTPTHDLLQVRAAFDAWRCNRQGKQRIPAPLWNAALLLLEHYPISAISRELGLSSQQIKKRRARRLPTKRPAAFLELTAQELMTFPPSPSGPTANFSGGHVSAVIERRDGGKLSLNLPISSLGTVISSFVVA